MPRRRIGEERSGVLVYPDNVPASDQEAGDTVRVLLWAGSEVPKLF
jgi:hypothetical protein